MDGPPHLLALKVMRVSRPTLATSWEPFYSSSPAFSAHSSASILSLQGKAPLSGHPKTLRDFSQATDMLTLPSSFGNIQLGETFTSCICLNNESTTNVGSVHLKIEMQTATSKLVLAELGGPDFSISKSGTLDEIVSHEIKELGQHVLACTVTYQTPHGASSTPADAEPRTFRKFYKFAVTNPLSVKTKVHVPRAPTATLSPTERHKVFLEIHIQNLTSDPLWFEHIGLQATDDWLVQDMNQQTIDGEIQRFFPGSSALMQPQDIRHFLYLLSPKNPSTSPVSYPPGANIPLGRFDIAWRSSFGEPGRLLTSMLTRRIPLVQVPPQTALPGSASQQPASALPPYLKRTATPGPPSRPQSPSGVSTPPLPRPGSPFSPRNSLPPATISKDAPPVPAAGGDLEAELAVIEITPEVVQLESPFSIKFRLRTTHSTAGVECPHLTIQHLHAAPLTAKTEAPLPLIPLTRSGITSPSVMSPTQSTFNYPVAHQKLSSISMRSQTEHSDPGELIIAQRTTSISQAAQEETKPSASSEVTLLGPSAIPLPIVQPTVVAESSSLFWEQEFCLAFLPLKTGLLQVGGLRVLVENKDSAEGVPGTNPSTGTGRFTIVKDWEVVAQIWVQP